MTVANVKHLSLLLSVNSASRVNSKIWEGGLPSILVASSLLRQRWIYRSDNFEIARERKRQGSENCPLNNWYVTFRRRPPCWMMAFFNGHTRREVHKKEEAKKLESEAKMMMVKATRCQLDLLIEAQTSPSRRDWLLTRLTTDKEQLPGTWTLEQEWKKLSFLLSCVPSNRKSPKGARCLKITEKVSFNIC